MWVANIQVHLTDEGVIIPLISKLSILTSSEVVKLNYSMSDD